MYKRQAQEILHNDPTLTSRNLRTVEQIIL